MTTPARVIRAPEDRALFNPVFVSILIARVVAGSREESDVDPAIPIAHVATAMALDDQVRASLTMTVRSHLGAWKYNNPAEASRIAHLYRIHRRNFTRGLLFGIHHGLLALDGARVIPGEVSIRKNLKGFSDDVEVSQRASFYLGRWLTASGSASSVLALLGVRS